MKNLHRKAFTLIELLIVIALLGALAVGLLAALDPFEQIKKGTDTGTRNTVSEIQGGIMRYYAIRGQMPWGASNLGMLSSFAGTNYSAVGIPAIISAGELKSDFSTLAATQLSNISIAGTSENVTICFKPLSKAIRNDPNTRFGMADLSDKLTNNVANCGDPSATSFSCVWCVR